MWLYILCAIKNLLEKISEYFQKAGENDASSSVQVALEISHEVNNYSNDMMKAGRIRDFPVCIANNWLKSFKTLKWCSLFQNFLLIFHTSYDKCCLKYLLIP